MCQIHLTSFYCVYNCVDSFFGILYANVTLKCTASSKKVVLQKHETLNFNARILKAHSRSNSMIVITYSPSSFSRAAMTVKGSSD